MGQLAAWAACPVDFRTACSSSLRTQQPRHVRGRARLQKRSDYSFSGDRVSSATRTRSQPSSPVVFLRKDHEVGKSLPRFHHRPHSAALPHFRRCRAGHRRVGQHRQGGAPVSALVPTPFDYSTLATDDLAVVRSVEKAIHSHRRRAADEAIAIGNELIRAKAVFPHGGFERWIDTAFRFTPGAALNFMHMATNLANKTEIISGLPPMLLYNVAAPSLTEETRAQILAPRDDGARPTADDIGQRLYEHQKREKKKAEDAKLTPAQRSYRKRAAERDKRQKIEWVERHAQECKERADAAAQLAAMLRAKFNESELAEVRRLLKLASYDLADRLGGGE